MIYALGTAGGVSGWYWEYMHTFIPIPGPNAATKLRNRAPTTSSLSAESAESAETYFTGSR